MFLVVCWSTGQHDLKDYKVKPVCSNKKLRCFHNIKIVVFAELLRSNDHTVDFVKIPDRDVVELVVHGEIIYHCKIQDLQYGRELVKQVLIG